MSTTLPERIETLLGDCLSGRISHWPDDTPPVEALLRVAAWHGVQPLLYERLHRMPDVPASLIDAMHRALHRQTALDLLWRAELTELLAALHAAGVHPLLLKGTPLAFGRYPRPGLRPHGDTDLLIRPEQRARTAECLAECGYRSSDEVAGDYVSYQAAFTRTTGDGLRLVLDVHWRINNSQLLAPLLTHDELRAGSEPVVALGPHARTPGPGHTLLLACLHRAGHRADDQTLLDETRCMADRLIWLYDIHLLGTAFDARQWAELRRQAIAKRLGRIVADGLRASHRAFGTAVPEQVLLALGNDEQAIAPEVFDTQGWRRGWHELRALPDHRARGRFLRENLFPDGQYMLRKYQRRHRAWLPLLYPWRIASGLWRRGR